MLNRDRPPTEEELAAVQAAAEEKKDHSRKEGKRTKLATSHKVGTQEEI